MAGTRTGFLAAASLQQMPHLNGNPAKLVFHWNAVNHSASKLYSVLFVAIKNQSPIKHHCRRNVCFHAFIHFHSLSFRYLIGLIYLVSDLFCCRAAPLGRPRWRICSLITAKLWRWISVWNVNFPQPKPGLELSRSIPIFLIYTHRICGGPRAPLRLSHYVHFNVSNPI